MWNQISHRIPLFLFVLIICICAGHVNAQSPARLIKAAEQFYLHHKYRSALQYYKQGGNADTWDKKVKFRAAICQYEINDLDGAISLLNRLVDEGKTDSDVFLFLGKAFHHKGNFKQAIQQYKQFLRRTKEDHPQRARVKDIILRCANGIKQRYREQSAYVENLGTAVNTFHDEFAPVPSPNFTQRLYFASARDGSQGGMQMDDGTPDRQYGVFKSDMYASDYANGIWSSAEALDPVLNSRSHEFIYGFSADGQRMHYYRGLNLDWGNLVVDTFARDSRINALPVALGSFNPNRGDRDLFMYNDTMMLFASNALGGKGGFDLFYSIRRKGIWRAPVNLGETINSFYDDISPCLLRNGRVLFFSSNRRESVGGMDIFRATFDDMFTRWASPVNMGIPVNSGGNETQFRLAQDGLSGFFASDRKSGYGARDLYTAYFKDKLDEHLTLSVPLTFAHVKVLTTDAGSQSVSLSATEVREFSISDLTYEPNDLVLTPQNIKKLEVFANLLLIYPALHAELICHDVASGRPRAFDLYFSVKKAEQAANFLIRKGVDQNRLFVKGAGSYYPLSSNPQATGSSPAIERLNRRIEVNVYNVEGQPISLIVQDPNVPNNLRDPRSIRFERLHERLVYRIQIAALNQLLQNKVFEDYPDAMVELDPVTKKYRFMIGMDSSHRSAGLLLEALRTQGFPDAFMVAYVEGRRITKDQILDYAGEYPDLLNFLDKKN